MANGVPAEYLRVGKLAAAGKKGLSGAGRPRLQSGRGPLDASSALAGRSRQWEGLE